MRLPASRRRLIPGWGATVVNGSPTWLVILQAVSYGFAIAAVFISIIVYFATGSRFRARAYLDKGGIVAVEFYNRGRLAGTIVHVDLARKVPRKMRQDDTKWYPFKSAVDLPFRVEPGGFKEVRFEGISDSTGIFISVRYGAGNYRRISLRKVTGEFPSPPAAESA
jgi:hypothetical protein